MLKSPNTSVFIINTNMMFKHKKSTAHRDFQNREWQINKERTALSVEAVAMFPG
jgi:hypothetical protein